MSEKKPVNVIQTALVVLLVGAAFAIGSMWTELRMIKGDKTTVKGEQAEQQPADQPEAEAPAELTEDQWQEVINGAAGVKGSDDAIVTVVEFSDYQCPFCKRHVDQTLAELDKEYINQGKVRYLFRDLVLPFHANAKPAAIAARCAGEQGQYFNYHDVLFANQTVWSEATDPGAEFKSYAADLGLNQVQFDGCYDQEKYAGAVDKDLELANKVGANGTPTFFINGTRLVGAQPLDTFKQMIDEGLK